jgi:hypothetical protein
MVRIATLAAVRWLRIHPPTPAIASRKLTVDTLQFGHRLRADPAERDEPDAPPRQKQKL